jgi:hypothetical protein
MTHKHRKKLINSIFLSAGCSLLGAEGFSCSLDVLYEGLGIRKSQFFIKKEEKNFTCIFFFFSFWSSKLWIQIGSGFNESGSKALLNSIFSWHLASLHKKS